MMFALVVLLLLGRAPFLGPAVPVQQADGRWKCAAQCHTSGNADGGDCRTPLTSHDEPSEAACTKTLADQCAKTKPPPGGCRLEAPR